MKNFKQIIKQWFTEKPLTATEAYSVAKYGRVVDESTKLQQVINSINDLIKFKSQNSDTSLIYELNNSQHNYSKETKDLLKYFKDLGFFVQDITLFDNPYLFISWKTLK